MMSEHRSLGLEHRVKVLEASGRMSAQEAQEFIERVTTATGVLRDAQQDIRNLWAELRDK